MASFSQARRSPTGIPGSSFMRPSPIHSDSAPPRGAARASAVSVLLVVLVTGCQAPRGAQAPRVAQPLTSILAADDADTRMEFWHALSEQPRTTNDDAFHALLLSFDGADPAPDYAARVERLKSRKMLPRNFAGA